jgi:DNA-binding MarR family transcriptional regulator
VPPDRSASELSDAGQVVTLLLHAHQAVHEALEAGMRERLGISASHFDVLRALVAAPGGQLRMVDIAGRLRISRSGVTQSVDRLENLGLVSRTTRRGDRRLVLAEITPEGRSLVPAGRQIIEAVASRFIAETLTGRQAAVLAASLAKVVAVSTQPSPEPDPVS